MIFLDGKQRTTTIIKFLNNEFPLVNIPVFEEEDGAEVDLNGLTYERLPEEYKERVKTYGLTVYYYENMEQDDAEEMFRRLNNGKSLTAVELARAKAASRQQIFEMGKHEFFEMALSEKSLIGHANEDIIVKVWMTLYGERKSLEKRNTNPIMERTKITNVQEKEIIAIFDTLASVYKNLVDNQSKRLVNKLLNKTNIISLSTILKEVNDKSVPIEIFGEWVIHFFDTKSTKMSISDVYNEAATGRDAVTEAAVITRMETLTEDFGQFLSEQAILTQKADTSVVESNIQCTSIETESIQDNPVKRNDGQDNMPTGDDSSENNSVIKSDDQTMLIENNDIVDSSVEKIMDKSKNEIIEQQ